jgi:hypothetical protein
MAHFRSGTRNEDGSWTYSLQLCIEQFREAFPNFDFDYKMFRTHKKRIIERFETKNCICKWKSTGRPTVITENVLQDIQNRMEASPTKSLRRLLAQSGLYFLFYEN